MDIAGEVALYEAELALQSAKLLELLDHGRPRRAPADAMAMQLGRLVGTWRRMILVRDRELYLPLLVPPIGLLGSMAIACRARMEGLSAALEGCVQRWPTSEVIEIDRRRFAAELRALIALTRAHFDCDRSLLISRAAERASAAA